jgi:hypothetical protein
MVARAPEQHLGVPVRRHPARPTLTGGADAQPVLTTPSRIADTVRGSAMRAEVRWACFQHLHREMALPGC